MSKYSMVSSWNGAGSIHPPSYPKLGLQPPPLSPQQNRRHHLLSWIQPALAIATSSTPSWMVSKCWAIPTAPESLGKRLARREDASAVPNQLFHLAPITDNQAQRYPEWMYGNWQIQSQFDGYIFPSTKISKQRLIQNKEGVAGFQKCSIATVADIGTTRNVQYNFRIDPQTGWEDRAYNIQQQIDAYLGYPAVNKVLYNAKTNPNRISIEFVPYKTINAERIELFCNARESELYSPTIPPPPTTILPKDKSLTTSITTTTTTPVFVCAEYMRQVTFGTGNINGIPRQVVTNYANFWSWHAPTTTTLLTVNPKNDTSMKRIQGNLLTCAYLDPQDPMYFEEPINPVAIYSHQLTAIQC